jgi:hypothetical protein
MAAATMVSLPPPPTTMTAILPLIALALAPPRTRIIGWQGGGHAVTHLNNCGHGRHHWCHFVSTRGTTAPRMTAAVTDEAVTPISTARKRWDTTIGVEQQKQKQKQKHNQKLKQNQQQWQQRHCLYACRQLCPCCRHCCLCMSRGSSSGSMGVAVAAAEAEQ